MKIKIIWGALFGIALLMAAGCGGSGRGRDPGPAAEADADAGHGEAGEEAEASDLDVPLEVLFARECEHGKKTYECDICRYEVGMVKVSPDLFADGLLKMAKAERRPVASAVRLTGEVQFDERRVAHVSSPAEGVVRRALVALGEAVKAGQPLLEIDSPALADAQAGWLEARAQAELARQGRERSRALRAAGVNAERELEEAEAVYAAAAARSAAALARLRALGQGEGEARGARGVLVLRSPAAGRVLRLHATPGELARVEEPLLAVGDNASVWVTAQVYERDLAALAGARDGLPARVRVKAYPGEVFAGRAGPVDAAMDEATRTARLRVEVQNPDGRLWAGMFAEVELSAPGEGEALAVPSAAVLADAGRAFVFVRARGDYFVRRPVTAGRTWAEWTEVKEGLAEGQEVVAEGCFLLKSDVLRSKMGAGCAD